MSSLTEKILSAHPQVSAHPQGPKLNWRPERFFEEIKLLKSNFVKTSQSERVLRSRGFQDRGGRKFLVVALQVARKKLQLVTHPLQLAMFLSRHRYVHVARKFSLVQHDLKGLDNFVSLCTIYFLFIPNCTQNQQQQQQQLLSFVTIIFVMLMNLIQTTRKDVDKILCMQLLQLYLKT